jgi:hypothetical protein
MCKRASLAVFALSGSSSCWVYVEVIQLVCYLRDTNILYDLLKIVTSVKVDVLIVHKGKLDMANN